MNFCRRAGHGQRRQRSDFGGDLDYFVDSGSLITIRRWSVNGDLAVISAGARSTECSLLSVLKLHAKIVKSFTPPDDMRTQTLDDESSIDEE